MHATSRREFMKRAAACSGAAGFLLANAAEVRANPLGLPIGSQVYPLRSMLEDFPAFVKKMAEIGVTRLELCSPIGYGRDFASLASGKEVRKVLADHGMKAESSHFSMRELRNSQEKSIEWAKEVGITQMITATLGDGNGGNQPDARPGETGGRRIQQDRRRGGEGRHPAGPAQRGLRALDGRRQADLRPAVRPARSEAGQVPVPDVDDHGRPRRRRLLPEVPRPLHLDASAGRGHERAGAGSAHKRLRKRSDAVGAARRLRWGRGASTG